MLQKNTRWLWIVTFMVSSSALYGASIVITAPAHASTVIGSPLVISGTSSQAGAMVRVTVNTTVTAMTTTNGSGNWTSASTVIYDGPYTIRADLLDVNLAVLATATNSFTVVNPSTIHITAPRSGDFVAFNPVSIVGTTSLPSATVNVSVDGILAVTTSSDALGNWSAAPSLTTNGVHTLLAQLMVAATPVASSSIGINAVIPIFYPSGKSQMRIIDGNIPTTGSGSGAGYTYVVSGSTATITFTTAFTSAPAVVATGLRSAGSSTITLASVSTSAITLSFSANTQRIHFTASALA